MTPKTKKVQRRGKTESPGADASNAAGAYPKIDVGWTISDARLQHLCL